MSQDTMSILERAGSRGNSTISRPVEVRPPGRGEQGQRCSQQWTKGRSAPGARVRPHTCVVQGPEDPELVHGVEHVVLRGWVHEVELQQILHPQGLEQQHHVGKVGPLDLGHGGGQELILVSALCVEPAREESVTGLHPPVACQPLTWICYTQGPSAECQQKLLQSHKYAPISQQTPHART